MYVRSITVYLVRQGTLDEYRYLEHGDFALVREGLRERAWWLSAAPDLARPLEILLPIYHGAPRGKLTVRAGLIAYDLLAGRQRLGWHRWMSARELNRAAPALRNEGNPGPRDRLGAPAP